MHLTSQKCSEVMIISTNVMDHFSGHPLYEISAQSLEDKKETLKTLNFFLESILKIFTLCNLMDHYIIGSFLPYCLYIDVMCKD